MSGLVVDQHPGAGGYPYSRTRYENSPLARDVQRGIPGADFAIIGAAGNTHTTSIRYGINDATLGLTPGRYFSETLVDPDGITRVTLTDQRPPLPMIGRHMLAGLVVGATNTSLSLLAVLQNVDIILVKHRSPSGVAGAYAEAAIAARAIIWLAVAISAADNAKRVRDAATEASR